MIRIQKDQGAIPNSLQVPPNTPSARTTHKRRQDIINNRSYVSNSSNNKRYKMADIKRSLFAFYNGKCAFCEQRVEQWQVEHFRPKSIYYWLAFSWDNLLYACPDCNGAKSNTFDTDGPRTTTAPADLTTINNSSASHDATEVPRFFNPEIEDPEPHIVFQQDGSISSTNPRVDYTIRTCKIDRPYLNDYRKKIWDDFIKDLESEVLDGTSQAEIKASVQALMRKFIRDAMTRPLNEYLAFRRYAVRHFLEDKVKEVLT